ncbi:MAG: carboxylating nicotinate-nucleotide diphosphorylase [Pseudomonadota bacterium]|nr:carboxylating nicotinate-nucleotide diphosphorylase [Pseudomonadota bacterium]
MIDEQKIMAAARENVRAALEEDLGSGDISALLIASDTKAQATVITRSNGIFCGQPWVEQTVASVDSQLEISWFVADGDAIHAKEKLFEVSGSARSLLTTERTMLNFVQLLSGTATRTAQYVQALEGSAAILLDTRKTIPGLRIAQKYAVTCGGGTNHRIGLYDAYLLKENHIAATGSIAAAVAAARAHHPDMPIEVEVESLDELSEAITAGADIAMIDNFTLEQTRNAVINANGAIKLEASGGIEAHAITEIAQTGVDYISTGDLTKTVMPLDLSMRFTD